MSRRAPARRLAFFTTFHAQGYRRYGRQMLEAFDRHWPREIELYAYYEGLRPEPVSPRVHLRDLEQCCPDLIAFKQRHRHHEAAHGREDRGRVPIAAQRLLDRLIRLGQSLRGGARRGGALERGLKRWGLGYRWDAVRFAHKTYCVFHAVENIDADGVFWLDADTVTFRDVPFEFVDGTLPEHALVSFLGRRHRTSECGYVGYNRLHPRLGDFLARWKHLYDSDELFSLAEWHDSWVFDWVRRSIEREGVATHDLSLGLGRRSVNHPFVNGPLGAYMDHLKGDRKKIGHSLGSDLLVARPEAYWQRHAGAGEAPASDEPQVEPAAAAPSIRV